MTSPIFKSYMSNCSEPSEGYTEAILANICLLLPTWQATELQPVVTLLVFDFRSITSVLLRQFSRAIRQIVADDRGFTRQKSVDFYQLDGFSCEHLSRSWAFWARCVHCPASVRSESGAIGVLWLVRSRNCAFHLLIAEEAQVSRSRPLDSRDLRASFREFFRRFSTCSVRFLGWLFLEVFVRIFPIFPSRFCLV